MRRTLARFDPVYGPESADRSTGRVRGRDAQEEGEIEARGAGQKKTKKEKDRRQAFSAELRQGVLIVNIAWRIRYFGGSDRELWRPVGQTKRTES